MKTNHTPAPWHVAESRSDMPFIINSTGKLTIANSIHGASSDEQGANARLIAAAPDLLAMLIDCCDTFSGEDEYLNGCSTRDMAQKCRAAIAKAKGN